MIKPISFFIRNSLLCVGFISPQVASAICQPTTTRVNTNVGGTIPFDGAGATKAGAIAACLASADANTNLTNTACRSTTPMGQLSTNGLVGACDARPFFDYTTSQWYASGASVFDCCIDTPPPVSTGIWPFTTPGFVPTMPPPVYPASVLPVPPKIVTAVCPSFELPVAPQPNDMGVRGQGTSAEAAIGDCNDLKTYNITELQKTFYNTHGSDPTAHLVVTTTPCDKAVTMREGDAPPWSALATISVIGCASFVASPSPTSSPTPMSTPDSSPSPMPTPESSPTPMSSPESSPTPMPSPESSQWP